MLKRIVGMAMAMIVMSSMSVNALAPIGVVVDGVPVQFTDVQPQVVNDRIMIPLRGVLEALGFFVTWDDNSRQAFITSPRTNNGTQLGQQLHPPVVEPMPMPEAPALAVPIPETLPELSQGTPLAPEVFRNAPLSLEDFGITSEDLASMWADDVNDKINLLFDVADSDERFIIYGFETYWLFPNSLPPTLHRASEFYPSMAPNSGGGINFMMSTIGYQSNILWRTHDNILYLFSASPSTIPRGLFLSHEYETDLEIWEYEFNGNTLTLTSLQVPGVIHILENRRP